MSKAPQVEYDFNPNNLPPEFLQAVGLMVAASAQTEAMMQHLIGALAGVDQAETLAITAHMSAPLKDHVARALIELNATSSGVIDTVDDLLDAVDDAQTKRNVVVHNAFARNPETGEIFSYRESARGSLQVSLQPVRVEEITKDANAIYEVGLAIVQFMLAWGLAPLDRTRPIRAPLNRKKKARQERMRRRFGDGA